MPPETGRLVRRVGVAFTGLYLGIVAVFALLKAKTSFFAAQPWAEVVYGPAITVGCSFLLFLSAVWIELWIRGHD